MKEDNRIRNFCIIAHIDHGKSTLADRIIEFTGTLSQEEMKNQILDDMDLERERGITIKSHPIKITYSYDNYLYDMNLIDTPGHVDFTYEVSRSMAACEGAILVVDAAQGVEAQTVSNAYLAIESGLTIIPVINKIDIDNINLDDTKKQVIELIGCKNEDILLVSAKEGTGIDKVLEQKPKKCIVVDNLFNSDKTHDKLNNELVKFYPLDISKLDEMQYIFETYKPNYVFHCASMLIQDSETLPRKSINTNIMGTFNIVDLSNKYGVEKICYSSSASVYGEPQYLPVDEEHPFQYNNFVYGWTKISAEMIFRSNCKVDWLGYRYYNVYSDRMREGAFYTQVFPIFYNKIKNGEDITIFGDGSQTMDLIHADDIARANILGLESEVTGEFFNVGSGKETKVSELAKTMMDIMNKRVKIVYKDDDSQKVKNRRSSTNKIKTLLGFSPNIKVKDGLRRYVSVMDD